MKENFNHVKKIYFCNNYIKDFLNILIVKHCQHLFYHVLNTVLNTRM